MLFHPRRDQWSDHFEPRRCSHRRPTSVGRATVYVLAMNDPRRLELRAELLEQREFQG